MPLHSPIHWPDKVIGKRESRRIRDAHNALYNDYHLLAQAASYLKQQTVDMDLNHGIELTEGETEARDQLITELEKTAD